MTPFNAGLTPTGERLRTILNEKIAKLELATGTPAYAKIKPVDLIVLTDGEPSMISPSPSGRINLIFN